MPGGVGGEDREASPYPDKDLRKAFSNAFERPEGLRSTESLVSQFRRGALVGITISHYKAIVKIGQGGMGEVYRAEDTNLIHEMAIKVLPAQFTQDPERLARFQREARGQAGGHLKEGSIIEKKDLLANLRSRQIRS
jgi:serine/threonine protein kinase